LTWILQRAKLIPKVPENKNKKKKLVFKANEESKNSERARKLHADRRAKLNWVKSHRTIRKVWTQSYSPSKVKKRRRMIITGDSPIKIGKIKPQVSVPEKREESLEIEKLELKLFLQSSPYSYLKETIQFYDLMKKKVGTEGYDIESSEGQAKWGDFLKSLHKLWTSLGIKRSERS
jgi:hypothetical protein